MTFATRVAWPLLWHGSLQANESITPCTATSVNAQLTSITLPDKARLSLGYDQVSGRLVSTTLPGTEGTVGLTYDATTGRLVSQSLNGQTVTTTYNGDLATGLSFAGPVAGTVALGCDKNHWLVSERVNTEAAIAYAYDDDGLVTAAGSGTITHSADNGAITATTLAKVKATGIHRTASLPVTQQPAKGHRSTPRLRPETPSAELHS